MNAFSIGIDPTLSIYLGPGRGHDGGRVLAGAGADALLDVHLLPGADAGMLGRLLEGQPQPQHVPEDAHDAVEVVGSVPPDGVGQDSWC